MTLEAESLADAVVACGAPDAVVGVLADGEQGFAAAGRSGLDPSNSVLEAGSITKTVIGLALAHLSSAGAVSRGARVSDAYSGLPEAVAAITLEELVTHTSGLPRLPPNLWDGADRQNPYAHFGESHLRAALETTTVSRKSYAYSNFGFAVLGAALSKLVGLPLPILINEEVFRQLGLKATRISVTDEPPSPADVGGFGPDGMQKSHWDFTPWSAGCGAMRTTVQDLLMYIEAHMTDHHDLAAAMKNAMTPRVGTAEGFDVGYAWRCRDELRWHPGGTGAFGGLVGLRGSRAAAILANTGHDTWRAADDLLFAFLG
jgi:CubicO group peptidase (beta-lactamase class C family)